MMTLLAPLLVALCLWWPASAAAAGPGWVPPVEGPVVVRAAFDPPSVRWDAGHRGVDLASVAGAAVLAAGSGEVTYAAVLAGRGVVVVSHGALRTTYEPVSALVSVGDLVLAGDVLGLLDPGHGDPPPGEALLHWGLLRGETYLDPLSLLRRGPSRLVPVAPAAPVAERSDVSWPPWGMPLAAGGSSAAPYAPPRPRPATPLGAPAVAATAALGALGVAGAYAVRARTRRRTTRNRGSPPGSPAPRARAVFSRAGRRACRAAGARPWCASGRCGSR